MMVIILFSMYFLEFGRLNIVRVSYSGRLPEPAGII
jgi:hypothetical protein